MVLQVLSLFLLFQLASIAGTTYSYTGSVQTVTVPAGSSSMTVQLYGAGYNSYTYVNTCNGGYGGSAQATFTVTPGSTIYIYVGGQGAYGVAGYNGGGSGYGATGGNGATDIRTPSNALSDRKLVAGGGGGCFTFDSGCYGGYGGDAGQPSGSDGRASCSQVTASPTGGTQSTGGYGGYINGVGGGSAGSLGQGGNGFSPGGAGGGGGYYGGGGSYYGGGGGGSSYVSPSGTSTSFPASTWVGNGQATIVFNAAPTSQPTRQPSSQPSAQPRSKPSRQPTRRPTSQPSRRPSTQPSRQPSTQPSSQPTAQPFMRPSSRPSDQPLSHPSRQPSAQPTTQPTVQPVSHPSGKPSRQPSGRPSLQPFGQPTSQPSAQPNARPSTQPSQRPTGQPRSKPTAQPSSQPSAQPKVSPSSQPSSRPSNQPSSQPSLQPSDQPSAQPSVCPSVKPSIHPTCCPSSLPSHQPSSLPSSQPSDCPSVQPTLLPSVEPSCQPTTLPSVEPTALPSQQPSYQPTSQPQSLPTSEPSGQPSSHPSGEPSVQPTSHPSIQPLSHPSSQPSVVPSSVPSVQPTCVPSVQPTEQPTGQPSHQPVGEPSALPTCCPSSQPSRQPSDRPFSQPSGQPSVIPSTCPSSSPTDQPSLHPTGQSSVQPSTQPNAWPSSQPTSSPSQQPSRQPSVHPTAQPCVCPTGQPSTMPTQQPVKAPSVSPTSQPTSQPAANPFFNLGSLPSNASISVVGYSTLTLFKIVLPFQQVSRVVDKALLDIVLIGANKVGNVTMVMGSEAPSSLSLTQQSSQLVSCHGSISAELNGRSVSVMPDVNGDGYDDLIIGDPFAARCYVVFGNEMRANMSEGFTIYGESEGDLTGWSVSAAGDVNNDTLVDVIVGAPAARGVGAFYIVYGRNVTSDVYLSSLSSNIGVAMYGATKADALGLSVSDAGDVNKDGYDDVIVGAVMTSLFDGGAAYVVYGSRSLQSMDSIGHMSSGEGYKLSGPSYSLSGYSVSGAGDVNGDGYDDVLIGSSPLRKTLVPTAYVVYGSEVKSENVVLSQLTAVQGTVLSGGGVFVCAVGDVDADGYRDVLVTISSDPFNSQFGFLVTLDASACHRGTYSPTTAPSPRIPSVLPSRRPSVSGPSVAAGDELSVEPSQSPLERPSAQAADEPSVGPTVDPTLLPSTDPSAASLMPTDASRAPFTRPTIQPSVEYSVVIDGTQGSSYVRNNLTSSVVYVVNASIDVRLSAQGACGTFVVLKQPHTTFTTEYFNFSCDVIDLSSWSEYRSMDDLTIKSGSIVILLKEGQTFKIENAEPEDISDRNFRFAEVAVKPKPNKNHKIGSTFVVSAIVAVGIAVFVVYQVYKLWMRSRVVGETRQVVVVIHTSLPLDNETFKWLHRDVSEKLESDKTSSSGSESKEEKDSEVSFDWKNYSDKVETNRSKSGSAKSGQDGSDISFDWKVYSDLDATEKGGRLQDAEVSPAGSGISSHQSWLEEQSRDSRHTDKGEKEEDIERDESRSSEGDSDSDEDDW